MTQVDLDESWLTKIFNLARKNSKVQVKATGVDAFQGIPAAVGEDYVAIPNLNGGAPRIIPFSAIAFVELAES